MKLASSLVAVVSLALLLAASATPIDSSSVSSDPGSLDAHHWVPSRRNLEDVSPDNTEPAEVTDANAPDMAALVSLPPGMTGDPCDRCLMSVSHCNEKCGKDNACRIACECEMKKTKKAPCYHCKSHKPKCSWPRGENALLETSEIPQEELLEALRPPPPPTPCAVCYRALAQCKESCRNDENCKRNCDCERKKNNVNCQRCGSFKPNCMLSDEYPPVVLNPPPPGLDKLDTPEGQSVEARILQEEFLEALPPPPPPQPCTACYWALSPCKQSCRNDENCKRNCFCERKKSNVNCQHCGSFKPKCMLSDEYPPVVLNPPPPGLDKLDTSEGQSVEARMPSSIPEACVLCEPIRKKECGDDSSSPVGCECKQKFINEHCRGCEEFAPKCTYSRRKGLLRAPNAAFPLNPRTDNQAAPAKPDECDLCRTEVTQCMTTCANSFMCKLECPWDAPKCVFPEQDAVNPRADDPLRPNPREACNLCGAEMNKCKTKCGNSAPCIFQCPCKLRSTSVNCKYCPWGLPQCVFPGKDAEGM
ncbi:hypothetical protein IQ07DRAFT_685110 [Pyrenochaeta sp. DS3sAY3a]|nr:hypothetical protein IQ07DRAFT_685110 [Pyrenochaeta sp. DS3sAY3a]